MQISWENIYLYILFVAFYGINVKYIVTLVHVMCDKFHYIVTGVGDKIGPNIDVFVNQHICDMMTLSLTLTQEVCMMEAELCSAFSDPTRILILYELDAQAHTVSELTGDLQVPQPTVSRHLKILRDKGLVTAERQGTSMVYRLSDHRLLEALDLLRSVMRDRLVHRASLIAELE